jgi:thymidylate kinase
MRQNASISLKRALIGNVVAKNLFKLFVLIDYYITVVPKLIISSFSKDIIILDRYFTDLLVNMSMDLKENTRDLIITYIFMKSIMPKPTLTFLLLTKPKVLFTRKADIPSLNFSIQQCKRFNYIQAFDPNIIVISALEKIHSKVEKILSKIDASQ